MHTVSQTLADASNLANAMGIADKISLYDGQRASLGLDIVIVGCGLGGLATAFTLSKAGHRVTVLEKAHALGEVGAGIQVSPNVSRLLYRWGLGPALERVGVRPEAIVLRRYSTGERVSYFSWQDMQERYDAPYMHIHRADFHRLLFDLVSDTSNATIHMNANVTHLEPEGRPRLTLASGKIIDADLVIGTDGLRSMVRQVVIGRPDQPMATGDAAYRAIIPASLIENDPELRVFIDHPELTGWMAPRRHIAMYCIRAKRELNLVLVHPDDGSVESWSAEGSADKMRDDFSDFEPRIRKILALIPSTFKWKLMDRVPLESWVHPAGRVVLLGDACHPMLPYRAQGAAMAIEDAVVLGNLFSHISHHSQIAPLLHTYEKLRLPRTTEAQLASRLNQKIFHLPDGPEQEARDDLMRAAMHTPTNTNGGNPNMLADQYKNDIQYGYDADKEAEHWWTEEGQFTVGKLGGESL